jgi:hypothetical protein
MVILLYCIFNVAYLLHITLKQRDDTHSEDSLSSTFRNTVSIPCSVVKLYNWYSQSVDSAQHPKRSRQSDAVPVLLQYMRDTCDVARTLYMFHVAFDGLVRLAR